ncbi:DeoR/GlpR family DNA-binding transcription regulator [Tropicimonas isoalkanivorans]|uniref:Transcriptional regulator, DeoR family n=1 Tax=Tropicimonas isoalkanivorans TaxID=441112 RepID=A0A1I1DE01_9RHOB|nr:DeoR/GlpR family DNA-binding transcription regulator [Tropicimonas isoalkanivorans]SFB73209.1 transcriptional regulator, DeoR family [Tropicimonas isoalkanivorans]
MKPKDRQAKILEIVSRTGEVSVETLAGTFDISLETVRRDLESLASTGALHKVRGGARRIKLMTEGSYRERMVEHAEAKAEIGRKLCELVEDGDTIFMDTGTTTLACADALAARSGLTVITNSLHIAQRLGEQPAGHRLFLLGGAYGADNSQTVGSLTIEQAERYQADHAVLTVAALDAEAGAMDADFDEAQVARTMIEHARNAIVLANSGKFGRRAAFRVCRLDRIGVLVSERRPEGPLADALGTAGVRVA